MLLMPKDCFPTVEKLMKAYSVGGAVHTYHVGSGALGCSCSADVNIK